MKRAVFILIVLSAIGIYFGTRSGQKISAGGLTTNRTEPGSPLRHEEPNVPKEIISSEVSPAKSATARHETIELQIATITEASTKSDSNSFQMIIGALQDERPEIRKAALDATMQFGSREAIPFLEAAAAKTEDAREKVEILDAIEFLKLPSLSEVQSLRRINFTPARR